MRTLRAVPSRLTRQRRRSQALGIAVALLAVSLAGSAALAAASPPAVQWLTRAAKAPDRISYSATETLVVRSGKEIERVLVRVVHRAPDDTRREFLSDSGAVERIVSDDGHSHWQYVPRRKEIIFSPSVRVDRQLWEEHHLGRLLNNYAVDHTGRAVLGGRPVRSLVIAPRSGHRGPSKRLWIDEQTGLILKSEITSSDGKTRQSSTLSRLRFEKAVSNAEFVPPAHARKQTVIWEHVAVLPLATLASHWKSTLLVPTHLPGGYGLESARLLRRGRHTYVHLRYFDGLNTLSLFEEPSRPPGRAATARRGADQVRGHAAVWGFDPPFRTLTWRERGLRLALVGDLPEDDLERIAWGLRSAVRSH
jgi:negative regulator of sigma E activity